ncbi:MAG: hypothetical protein Q8Q49_02610, partial [bacterium]|nr:hypothetical protein [bacterium]
FGLLVVFLLRSYPNKTKYLPHIFTLFLFLAGMFLGYAYWLFALSNVTQNQLQYADRMGNIMFHWNPLHFAHIPAISSQYREYMHRLFYYSSYFLGFFGIPLALTVFLRRGSPYFEKLQKKNVLAGIALVGFIACMPLLFYPPEWERFAVFHAPEFVDGILFKLLGSVHYKDVIWTIMMLLSFPFWVLFLPDCLKRLHQLFLRKRQHIFIRDYFLGIGIAFLGFLYIIYKVQSIYGFNFFRDSFVFLFYFFIAIIFFTSRFFFRLRRNIPITISSFGIFFLFLFFTHLFFTVLAFGRGDEYLLPFYPLFILFLAWSFDMRKLSKAGMLTALLVLALVSVMYARRDYQHVGIIWEEYTSLLGRGVVNVRNSDDFALAWRRYHFQEPSFQKMLKKTNGDKRLIPLKSWESMEEYQKQSKEPYVSVDLCGNIIHRKGEKLIRRFEEKSLFMDDSYCVVLFPPGTF